MIATRSAVIDEHGPRLDPLWAYHAPRRILCQVPG